MKLEPTFRLRIELFYLPLILALWSCNNQVSITGFDPVVWASDKLGCRNERLQFAQVIEKNRELLLHLDQNEVEHLLGLPDEHELDERKRKYFYYYLEPGNQCNVDEPYPIRLSIKFSAMGISTEVFLENY